jgi:hypothetical protein
VQRSSQKLYVFFRFSLLGGKHKRRRAAEMETEMLMHLLMLIVSVSEQFASGRGFSSAQ